MKISEDSIRWAITHLQEYGDTDLFPKPIELDIISEDKESVIRILKEIDITTYNFNPSRRFMIPKDELSYRMATQLHPIDSILISAIIYEYGALIEKSRESKNKVFSYRFSPNNLGQLYSEKSSWKQYWEVTQEKLEEYEYVAYIDISDFYNQIYHHSIENQLINCGLPNQVVKFIIRFLTDLTKKNSRGIPIGPHITHLLSELVLDSIDKSLVLKGYDFCRYVDDYVIFTSSYEEARAVFYTMAVTLDKQQRLIIQKNKSNIFEKEDYLKICSNMIIDDPINETEEEIIEIINEHSEDDPYKKIKLSDLSDEDLKILSSDNINELLNEYISSSTPKFSRIRWLYRRLAQIGIPYAVNFSIENFEKLTPAINDVCLYLSSSKDNYVEGWKNIGEEIIKLLDWGLVKDNEYFNIVLLNLFLNNKELNNIAQLFKLYNSATSSIKRKVILIAYKNNAKEWIRELKEQYEGFDKWNKYAYIIASSCMIVEERKFFLKGVSEKLNSDDYLEKILIKWAQNK